MLKGLDGLIWKLLNTALTAFRVVLSGIINADKFKPGMLKVLLGATAVMILLAELDRLAIA